MRLALFDQLPRLDPAEVYRDVELEPVRPATAPEVRAAGARRLVDACFAAVGVHPGDTSPRGEVLGARSAAASLGRRAGIGNGELEWALGASPRTLRRLAKMPPDIAVQRPALLQIAITDTLQRPVASSRGA